MKFISKGCLLAWLLLGLVFGAARVEASTSAGFGLSAYNSTNSAFLTNTIYTIISLTNNTGETLTNTFITNDFSGAVTFSTFTNTYDTNNYIAITNENSFSIDLLVFTNGTVYQLILPWQPGTAGQITNSITVSALQVTNTAATNLVTSVFAGAANLAVGISYVSLASITTNYWVITNDWLTYAVSVTNEGPDTATGVLLTNVLPTGSILKKVSGNNYSTVSNTMVFNLGTMADQASVTYQITIQPTNAGAFALVDEVGATNLLVTNVLESTATDDFFVTNYIATLTVATNSGQTLNYQNGLMEQTVLANNTSGSTAAAVRVVVTGLTNELFNAYGTNNGSPFVTCPANVAAGGGAQLRLQYFPRTASSSFPFTNGQLHAYVVPASVLQYTPYPPASYSTNLNISRLVRQSDGDVLIEFPSTLGSSYTIVYSDNVLFSNAMIAAPAYIAPANRVQWLDYGPPATSSAPTNSTQRFYRVYLNP